eukprot:gene7242-biopygen3262
MADEEHPRGGGRPPGAEQRELPRELAAEEGVRQREGAHARRRREEDPRRRPRRRPRRPTSRAAAPPGAPPPPPRPARRCARRRSAPASTPTPSAPLRRGAAAAAAAAESVVLRREAGGKIGIRVATGPHGCLRLMKVQRAAERGGLARFVGWELRSVNGAAVASQEEVQMAT